MGTWLKDVCAPMKVKYNSVPPRGSGSPVPRTVVSECTGHCILPGQSTAVGWDSQACDPAWPQLSPLAEGSRTFWNVPHSPTGHLAWFPAPWGLLVSTLSRERAPTPDATLCPVSLAGLGVGVAPGDPAKSISALREQLPWASGTTQVPVKPGHKLMVTRPAGHLAFPQCSVGPWGCGAQDSPPGTGLGTWCG